MDKEKEKRNSYEWFLILLMFLIILVYFVITKIGNIYDINVVFHKVITVSSENENWNQSNKLNIFGNEDFENQKVIAPGSKGTYNFYVENNKEEKITYTLEFNESYDYFVNMKYKLKMENQYVVGSENDWVSIQNMNSLTFETPEKTTNAFLLEWYWEDHEKDTIAGINAGNYTLELVFRTKNGNMLNS